MGQLGELLSGGRLDPEELAAVNVHAVEEQHVEVNVEIQRAAETLDEGDGASASRGVCVTGLVGQMRGNGAVDDAQHTPHDIWATGKQKAQWERYASLSLEF